MLKYLHFFPDAFAAKVLCFVQVVCSEAACQGIKISDSVHYEIVCVPQQLV